MGSVKDVLELSQLALADSEGVIVVLRIYMDESGIHGNSPVVTVAAYMGRKPAWKSFTKDWNAAKRPIKVFHATDCEALRGEFEGWDEERRNTFVANLLPVLPKHRIYGLSFSFPLQELEKALAAHPGLKQLFGNPYTACFRISVRLIVEHVIEKTLKSNDALAFIHEDNDYQGEALDAFNFVKAGRREHAGRMTLQFGSKARFTPLQAADTLAFESNKRVRDPNRPWRRSFIAINPGGKHCDVLYYSAAKLDLLVKSLLDAQEEAKNIGLSNFSLYGKVPPFFRGERSS